MKHALNLALALLLAIGPPVRAAPRDVSSEIAALRPNIVSAEVVLAPHNMEARGEVQERDLAAYACTYRVTGEKDLGALVDLLAGAGIAETGAADPYEMRVAVYLHTRAGAALGIATGQEFDNAPASGLLDRTVPITTAAGFEAGLRSWAARLDAPVKSGRCR